MVNIVLGILFFGIGFFVHRTYAVDANVMISIVIGGLAAVIGGAAGGLIKPLLVNKVPTSAAEAEAAAASEVILEPSEQTADESGPSGTGGWLGLFALGIVFSLIASVRILYGNILFFGNEEYKLLTDPDSSYYVASMFPSLVIETALVTTQILMILYIVYLGLKHKKSFKYICISFIAYNILINIIDTLMFSHLQSTLSDYIPDDNTNNTYTDLSRSFIYAIIWIPYFLRSKRVKNTFVK